jgi:very-short-patch-repair endonuclease
MASPSDKTRFARRLRDNLTECEKILWTRLSRFKHLGYHFRRQVALGPYVVDFLCVQVKVVVEADGAQHADPANVTHDEARDNWLRSHGYLVLRYANSDIRRSLDAVCDGIFENLRRRCLVANIAAEAGQQWKRQERVKQFEAGAAPTRPAQPSASQAGRPRGAAKKYSGELES